MYLGDWISPVSLNRYWLFRLLKKKNVHNPALYGKNSCLSKGLSAKDTHEGNVHSLSQCTDVFKWSFPQRYWRSDAHCSLQDKGWLGIRGDGTARRHIAREGFTSLGPTVEDSNVWHDHPVGVQARGGEAYEEGWFGLRNQRSLREGYKSFSRYCTKGCSQHCGALKGSFLKDFQSNRRKNIICNQWGIFGENILKMEVVPLP